MSDLADKIREQLKFNEAEVDTLLGDERFGMSTITGKEDIAWLTEQLNKLAEVKCREVVLGLVTDQPEREQEGEASVESLEKEYFRRGRDSELRQWRQHLIDHNPAIPGICSWCKGEAERQMKRGSG